MDHPLDLATVPSSVHLIGRACAAALWSLHVWAVVASHLHHVLLCIVKLKGPYAVTHVGSNRTTQRPHLYRTTGHHHGVCRIVFYRL